MEKLKHYTRTIDMTEYRDLEFTGYYWMSDKSSPNVVDGKFELPEIGANPFIVEANLYDKKGSVSISIEHIDGKYLIGIVDWKQTDANIVLESQTYLSHGLEKMRDVKFVRAWIPVADHQCAGMEVLQPAWRAFVGFDDIPEEIKKLLTPVKD